MAKNKQTLTREFLVERDLRIFKMRQAGIPGNEIARRFGMSTVAVGTAVKRQLEKLNREALMAYPEVLRMELERLDNLQAAIWPMTGGCRQQPRPALPRARRCRPVAWPTNSNARKFQRYAPNSP